MFPLVGIGNCGVLPPSVVRARVREPPRPVDHSFSLVRVDLGASHACETNAMRPRSAPLSACPPRRRHSATIRGAGAACAEEDGAANRDAVMG